MELFLIFTGKELPEYSLVEEKTKKLIEKLMKLINEENPSNT